MPPVAVQHRSERKVPQTVQKRAQKRVVLADTPEVHAQKSPSIKLAVAEVCGRLQQLYGPDSNQNMSPNLDADPSSNHGGGVVGIGAKQLGSVTTPDVPVTAQRADSTGARSVPS